MGCKLEPYIAAMIATFRKSSAMSEHLEELFAYYELYYESYAALDRRWVACLN